MYQKFANTSELISAVENLPTASPVSIIRDDTGKEIKGYYAVKDDSTGEICVIVSKNYKILQHSEAFMPIAIAYEEQGADVFGSIDQFKGASSMRVLNRDIEVEDGSSQGLNLGLDIRNSFDKQVAFRGDAYAWRLVCGNGMISKHLFPDVGFSARHVGDIERIATSELVGIEESIREGVLGMEDIIRRARGNLMTIHDKTAIEFKLGIALDNMKHARKIVDMFYRGDQELSVYDIYNWVTDYTSNHPEEVSRNVAEVLNTRAGDFLRNPILVSA